MTLRTVFLWLVAIWLTFLLLAGNAFSAPPRPEPHPSACKGKRPCKATIVKRAYSYRIVWKLVDQDGNITYAPGSCTVPVRGPVTCSITISWG